MASSIRISEIPHIFEDPNKPEVWLGMLESRFRAYDVTCPIRKYHYIISTLHAQRQTDLIEDLLVSPPSDAELLENYEGKKQELLRLLRAPRVKRLLEQEVIGDRKPSEFLRHLREMCGAGAEDKIIVEHWISQLPNHAQEAVMIARDEMSLESLGRLADSIAARLMLKEHATDQQTPI